MEIIKPKLQHALLKDLYSHSEYLTRHLPLAGQYFAMFQQILEPSMPESHLDFLRQGAMLHDVGKRVGLKLLEKPEFSYEERRLMETHPEQGRKILTFTFGKRHPYTMMAFAHHERWDGKGYPQRLKGEEIPYYARLMTIADIFSTVTQPRPYAAKVFTQLEALELLEQEAGRIFDPNMVKPIVERLQYEFGGG